MFLPIDIFIILLVIAIGLFIFGASRESMSSGFAFLCLSAVLLIVTGLFIWSGGLQLNQVSTIDTTTNVITISYSTLTATSGSALWVIANVLTFGGIGLTLLSFVLTVRHRRQARQEEEYASA